MIERQARQLAPPDTAVSGNQVERIIAYQRAALTGRKQASRDFIPGTGRLGGQRHDLDDSPPVDPKEHLAAARAALHTPQETPK